ncbi:MAG: hypothetical protein A3H42_05705 [Deltaproteobacteria bacterium RIFCSPLOWO2_02_FULL_46_8]|nr:MAG: hypothetical protein A3H42_05705 [Deltaproteobacteria bacterium RIFCSPLOWO2_02_FULL_46_8]
MAVIGVIGILLGAGSLGYSIYQGNKAEERAEKQSVEYKADADKAKYKSMAMDLKAMNQNIEMQKRALAVDNRELLQTARKKKYKNYGHPVGTA